MASPSNKVEIHPAARNPFRNGPLLALGFGVTVAMWASGYICRMPDLMVPAPLVLAVMLAWLFVGGLVAGRYTDGGARLGAGVGLLAALLNLLILGSLLFDHESDTLVPSMLWWLPGSLIVSVVVCALGATVGQKIPARRRLDNGTGAFAIVGAVATLVLLVAGGLVTGHVAGLAVVDWPNSFGYNMFLYPLARMTGGIYYEHAHRLLGSLVGLTTVALAVHLSLVEQRRAVVRFAWLAVVAVIIQGVMGGLRVTGKPTLSMSPEEVAPNIYLALVHGVFGQIFFSMMTALAVVTSATWSRSRPTAPVPPRTTDMQLNAALVVILIVQITLGAYQRHLEGGLLIHISLAVIVAMLAVACGVRAWGLYEREAVLGRVGITLAAMVAVQLTLGVAAMAAVGVGPAPGPGEAHLVDVVFTTAHQTVGALLLANAVALALLVRRDIA